MTSGIQNYYYFLNDFIFQGIVFGSSAYCKK